MKDKNTTDNRNSWSFISNYQIITERSISKTALKVVNIFQTTLCYYDIKDALQVDPDHQEAKVMMTKMETRAQDNKREAMQLNLMGKHREALHKISIAIDTDPIVADFHVLR